MKYLTDQEPCFPCSVLCVAICSAFLSTHPLKASDAGAIIGTLTRPERVTAVTAVNRETDKKFSGTVDAKTGRFKIDGLPLGKTYDCMIDFAEARLEGVHLKVPRSEYEEEQPLSKEDIETITRTAVSMNKFEDRVDVLTVTGNIQHAAVLLNKLRLQPFFGSKPDEVIWRLELWHFERPEETWIKEQEELFLVLYRERFPKSEYRKKSLTLDPALGGLQPTQNKPVLDLGSIVLPSSDPGIRLRPNVAHDS